MRYFLFTICCLLIAASASAEDGGTVSPFDFGAGSRELAMGGASVTDADPVAAVYWNPARLATCERISVAGFYSQLYESDVVYQYAGFVWPTLDYGSFGLGLFHLGVSGIDKRDQNNFALGEFNDSRLAIHIAYGRDIGDYQVGFAAHIEHHSIDTYSASSSPGITVAVARNFVLNSAILRQFSLSVIGRNVVRPGTKLVEETVSYPFTSELGASFQITPGDSWDQVATLSVRLSKTANVDPKFAAGLEYTLGNMMHLRGGTTGSNLTLGGGLEWRSVSFDYALAERDLGSLHLFTVSTTLGGSVSEQRVQREITREAEFDALMSDRLRAGKNEMIGDLAARGRTALKDGDLNGAVDFFDRALFMARATGADTTILSEQYRETSEQLSEVEAQWRYRQMLDSAEMNMELGEFVAAQYYANLALDVRSGATQAEAVRARAADSISATASLSDLANRQAVLVDSLLSYGQIDRALASLQTMVAQFPNHELIQSLRKRATFERLKSQATAHFNSDRLILAAAETDSALVLFPGHQWGTAMLARIQGRRQTETLAETRQIPKAVATAPLSQELLAQVESSYQSARDAFSAGQLPRAIQLWETVERMAPDYKSVREYLVNAYKFQGVEFYGLGDLEQAIEVWEKAIVLSPANREIAGYLERTRTEKEKLREYSYGDQ